MKEHPILFSALMVRAILEGRKTVTRRIVKGPGLPCATDAQQRDRIRRSVPCPYGQPGDQMWVRETHSLHSAYGQQRGDGKRWGPWGGLPTRVSPDGTQIAYFREGFDRCDPGRWRPSIHMPRWASRITLEVTGVRVERLQDISEEQARAEGVALCEGGAWDYAANDWAQGFSAVSSFRKLWEQINGAGSWNANPWVWVVEFERVTP